MNRKTFVQSMVGAGVAGLVSPLLTFAGGEPGLPVRIGLLTDLHHLTFGTDRHERLTAFIDAAIQQKPALIVQLGDFTYPDGFEQIMGDWKRFPGPGYHVLGNHDMDLCDKETFMKGVGMPGRYYSFEAGGFHFVVLDRNNLRQEDGTTVSYATGNWHEAPKTAYNYVDAEQLQWLRTDLAAAEKPTIVFLHQPVSATDQKEIGNADEVMAVFDETNFAARQKTGKPRVIAVFMGHDHTDIYTQRNEIHYLEINSASYAYYRTAPCDYLHPLFCFVTFDPAGTIRVEGSATTYVEGVPEGVRQQTPSKISSRSLAV